MSRSDQNYTDLIADARVWPRDGVSKGPLINALADAIEALVKERDELAAVVEKAKNLAAEAGRFREADVDSWVNVYALKKVLYTAPADALAEHDAALIESLAERAPERRVAVGGGWTALVSSPCADWLRERARQVREGEA